MSGVRLEQDASAGCLAVVGELSFATVGELAAQGEGVFPDAIELDIDLAGVTRVDSAGLALLVEWVRLGRGAGRTIRLRHPPDQLLAIARASGLDKLLPPTAAPGPGA